MSREDREAQQYQQIQNNEPVTNSRHEERLQSAFEIASWTATALFFVGLILCAACIWAFIKVNLFAGVSFILIGLFFISLSQFFNCVILALEKMAQYYPEVD